MTTPRTFGNTDASGTQVNVPDVQFFGNGDTFQLLCKASSQEQGWMKSTKAMHIPGIGCVVQITTQQMNPDGTYAIAETAVFVPGTKIVKDGTGRKLAAEKKRGGAAEEPEPTPPSPPPAEEGEQAPVETNEAPELAPPPTEIPETPEKKD